MSKFSIDTDRVDNVADDINSLSPKVSSIKSSISGYDVSNDDGFDFGGAKDAIAHNIEGVETKINNTVKLLNAVVGTHSGLQNSVSDNSGNTTSSKTSSDNYSYSPSSGNSNYYSGTNTGGGFGYESPSNTNSTKKTTTKKTKNNKTTTSETIKEDDSLLDYDPFSVFSDKDLSAAELLDVELGATATTTAAAVSSLLTTNTSDGLTTTNTSSTITPEEIISKSQFQTIIVLETSSKETTTYKQIVEETARENSLGFHTLLLDTIIEEKQMVSGLNINLTNAIESSVASNEDTKEKTTEPSTDKEDIINDESEKEIKEESTELTDSAEKEEEKNTKTSDEPYTIINQNAYNTLMAIPTAGTAKNDLRITPVTLIIRNGIIIHSINGETTKEILNQAIKSLGISNNNIIK